MTPAVTGRVSAVTAGRLNKETRYSGETTAMNWITRLTFASALAIGSFSVPASAETPKQPNVIIIFIDDMGFGDVEFNGGTKAKTPHLNQMAKEGRRFHDFYVGCAVCSGSRTALMTGCHYQRLSMKAVLFPNSAEGLHPEEVTLADLGRVVVPSVIPKLSETPGEIKALGPGLGEHNAEIYGGLLGLSAEEIEKFKKDGVI